MRIPKPSDEDKAYFRSLVPDDPRVEVKPMFGNLGGFVNGNMFMGLFGADVGVKLAGADSDRLLTEDGAGPFGPEERPMAGYVTLPGSWRAGAARAGTKKAVPWIAKSLEQVGALPPKVAKKEVAKKPAVSSSPGRGRGASAPRRGGE